MSHPAPGIFAILSHWRFDPFWIIVLAIAAWWYIRSVRQLEAADPRVPHPRWKLWSFLGGLALIAIAVFSPLQHYGNVFLSVNFLGMLVLSMMAAPLIVISSPLTLAFRVGDRKRRKRLHSIYRSRIATIVMFPLFSWLFFAIVTYIWQFSELTSFAAHHAVVRDIELVSMVVVGLVFWMPGLCADPVRWRMNYPLRIFYIFVEVTHKALFGGMFLSMTHVFHPDLAAALPGWGPGALMDQRVGILFVTIIGNMIFLTAIAFTVWHWVNYEMRNTARIDKQLERERLKQARHKAAMEQIFRRTV